MTRFVAIDVSLTHNPAELQRSILTALQAQGEPLRWAITRVDVDRQIAHIEAVVLSLTSLAIPVSAVRVV